MLVSIVTVSDRCSSQERDDRSGPVIGEMLSGIASIGEYIIVPDEKDIISKELIRLSDETDSDVIFTTGGTGFAPRDVTPEATKAVLDKETPGISDAIRLRSLEITPRAMLSRAVSGIRGKPLIINLPGSEKGARENFNAVKGAIDHALKMIASDGSANCAG